MSLMVAVDYDGTLFEGSWPDLGDPKKDVIKQIKAFKKAGEKRKEFLKKNT